MRQAFGIVLLAFVSFGFITPRGGYDINDTVADFSLKSVDGSTISLSTLKNNKGAIVIFDCNTCPVSNAYNSRIIALGKKYAESFPLLLINANDPEQSPGDSFNEMVTYAKDKGYTFPYLVDETQDIARKFGATNTPHVFLLFKSEAGYKLAYKGAIDDNTRSASNASKKYVEQAIDALLAGQRVPVEKTKAVGCGIRWK